MLSDLREAVDTLGLYLRAAGADLPPGLAVVPELRAWAALIVFAFPDGNPDLGLIGQDGGTEGTPPTPEGARPSSLAFRNLMADDRTTGWEVWSTGLQIALTCGADARAPRKTHTLSWGLRQNVGETEPAVCVIVDGRRITRRYLASGLIARPGAPDDADDEWIRAAINAGSAYLSQIGLEIDAEHLFPADKRPELLASLPAARLLLPDDPARERLSFAEAPFRVLGRETGRAVDADWAEDRPLDLEHLPARAQRIARELLHGVSLALADGLRRSGGFAVLPAALPVGPVGIVQMPAVPEAQVIAPEWVVPCTCCLLSCWQTEVSHRLGFSRRPGTPLDPAEAEDRAVNADRLMALERWARRSAFPGLPATVALSVGVLLPDDPLLPFWPLPEQVRTDGTGPAQPACVAALVTLTAQGVALGQVAGPTISAALAAAAEGLDAFRADLRVMAVTPGLPVGPSKRTAHGGKEWT